MGGQGSGNGGGAATGWQVTRQMVVGGRRWLGDGGDSDGRLGGECPRYFFLNFKFVTGFITGISVANMFATVFATRDPIANSFFPIFNFETGFATGISNYKIAITNTAALQS